MDWGSLAGLVLALAAIAGGQWVEGGKLAALVQPAAMVIVLGGTLGAVLLQNGMGTLWRGLRLAGKAFAPQPPFYEALIASIQGWSKTARADGFLQLERYLTDQRDPFITKGMRMLVDNVDAETLRSILETDIDSYERWERQSIRVWEAAGGYAPTIGILGAVLGLMRVMDNLGEPALLGSGIAVAFVATVYGVALANLVCLPIANKLKKQLALELLKRTMLADALVSIARGENSGVIQERMNSHWQQGG
ncbi:flagellar motor protein [Malikia spinosa]|uniref:Flagellar motor protein n=1 Tax=Malikia spinosa TaxID=86180 RepID=A0A2S9KDH0_9BURK|nr:flagellar motor protein [Malikia spinosa]MYZ52850.1 flagellar motor protein [Malikia spinosa]OGB69654.1 MAG: flagellar motor protein [Burkholderiales bacterium RIFOXYC12_FULL_65_23]PRD68425.1 flagellar motor protein [Malikia spinosa]